MKHTSVLYIIIALLVAVIFLERSCRKVPIVPPDTITRDTTTVDSIIHIHDTLLSKPKIVKVIETKWDTIIGSIPDSTYTGLKSQYISLGNKFYSSSIYSDSLKIDTIGYVNIKDTISENSLIGRSYSYNLHYPRITTTITNTITKTLPPVSQLYIGGGLYGSKVDILQGAQVSLLYKNRRDQMYTVFSQIDKSGKISYGISTYWKIHF